MATFHSLGISHLPTRSEISSCAFTQKILKMNKMLKWFGHHVIFYGCEDSETICDEMVPVLSKKRRIKEFGEYDWRKELFRQNGESSANVEFHKNVIREIRKRAEQNDFMLMPMGSYHRLAYEKCPCIAVESGVGYEGIIADNKIFESYSWMHYLYGRLNVSLGRWNDRVIPNYFDLNLYEFSEKKQDYILFIGRIIPNKGIQIAIDVSRDVGVKLIIAGQGNFEKQGFESHDNVEFVGWVDDKTRSELLKNAMATFVPSLYLEPFGGVAVESQLCGTPVVTTDWGAFAENVVHGTTGFRCRNHDEFCFALEHIGDIDPYNCRNWAVQNYSMERVSRQYEHYWQSLLSLRQTGWYERNVNPDLDYLKKWNP